MKRPFILVIILFTLIPANIFGCIKAKKNRTADDNSAIGNMPVKKRIRVKGVHFNMIKVEGGTFTMGCTSEQGSDCFDSEKPAHEVKLSTFYIGETEVTQTLWKAVMGSNPSSVKKKGDYPVEKVSWDDCQDFIYKLNQLTGMTFRLPTEAEWEFAARGGNKSKGYKYSGGDTVDDVAWYRSNAGRSTHPVATKMPNELGLYDMSGNVWEWCQDWHDSYPSASQQTNPKGASNGVARILRGGSWYGQQGYCRVSDRFFNPQGFRVDTNGFRLVLVP